MSKKLFTTEPILPAQIADWKQEHKDVFAISVPSTDEPDSPTIDGFFRKPSIDELGLASSANKDNPLKMSKVIYNTCCLGGHPAFENDDAVILAALGKFGEIIKTREAEIKKL